MPGSVIKGREVTLPRRLLHEVFEEVVAKNGDKQAIIGKQSTTFEQLNRKANNYGRMVKAVIKRHCIVNLAEETTVAVSMAPGVDRAALVIGLWKIGAAYVPIDKHLPMLRVKKMLRDAKPILTVSDSESFREMNSMDLIGEGFRIEDIADIRNEDLDVSNISKDERFGKIKKDDPLATVLYTSGSTGVPKGVKLRHRNILNRLMWQWNDIPFVEGDSSVMKTTPLFIDSITEMFSCLLHGIPLLPMPMSSVRNIETFCQQLKENAITRLVLVPSLLKNILDYNDLVGGVDLPVKTVVCSGEELLPNIATRFFEVFPGCNLVNLYGSTETTGDVTYHVYSGLDDVTENLVDGKLSIGRPADNIAIFIVDEELKLVDEGCKGEILVSGLSVTDGYLMKEHNKDKFVPNTFDSSDGNETVYRTGDIGKIVNGKVIFEGRLDSELKIRGHRVNLEEIASVIVGISDVNKVHVLPYTQKGETKEIVAFYNGDADVTGDKILSTCKNVLPDYMMPRVLFVEEFPLQTQTGKVDREKLLQIYRDSRVTNGSGGNQYDELTSQVLKIISEEIGVGMEDMNPNGNFFEYGGNSVNAIQTIVTLKNKGIYCPIDLFLSAKTIGDIVEAIRLQPGYIDSNNTLPTLNELSEEKILAKGKYKVVRLNELPRERREEVMFVTCDAFCRKEPIFMLHNITTAECIEVFDQFFDESYDSKLTPVVLDAKTDRILCVDLMIRLNRAPDPKIDHQGLRDIVDFLATIEADGNDYKAKGVYASTVLLGAVGDLTPAESTEVVFLAEKAAVDFCRQEGMAGVEGLNIHPVTQLCAFEILNYKILTNMPIADFQFADGRKPFLKAPPDQRVIYGVLEF